MELTTEIPDNFTDEVSALVSTAIPGLVSNPDSSALADLTEMTAATTSATAPSTEDTIRGPSSGQYEMIAFWLWTVGIPIILLFGTFGNVMSALVARRLQKELRALSFLMTSLAVSDTAFLWIVATVTLTSKVIKVDLLGLNDVTCKVGMWLMVIMSNVSSWLLVTLTFQRAIAVVWPLKLYTLCTRKFCLVVVVCLVLAIALCYSHMIYGFEVQGNDPLGKLTVCFLSSTSKYKQFWDEVWSKVDLCISAVLPTILIIGSNITLSIALVKNKMRMSRALAQPMTNQRATRDQIAVFTIVIVMSVSVTFLCLTVPFFVSFALFGSGETPLQVFISEVTLFMYYCNNAINFYIYVLTGTKYRQTVKAIFT